MTKKARTRDRDAEKRKRDEKEVRGTKRRVSKNAAAIKNSSSYLGLLF
jgi:hypothetical protein